MAYSEILCGDNETPDYDAPIQKWVDGKGEDPWGSTEHPMGIENPAGDIYRVVVTEGLTEMVGFDQFMTKQGFSKRSDKPTGKYTDIYFKP